MRDRPSATAVGVARLTRSGWGPVRPAGAVPSRCGCSASWTGRGRAAGPSRAPGSRTRSTASTVVWERSTLTSRRPAVTASRPPVDVEPAVDLRRIQRPVPGSTCIVPIAPAGETRRCCQPDSCQAIARASSGSTWWCRRCARSPGDLGPAGSGPAPRLGLAVVPRLVLLVLPVLGGLLVGVAGGASPSCGGARPRPPPGSGSVPPTYSSAVPAEVVIARSSRVQAWKRTPRAVTVSPRLTRWRTPCARGGRSSGAGGAHQPQVAGGRGHRRHPAGRGAWAGSHHQQHAADGGAGDGKPEAALRDPPPAGVRVYCRRRAGGGGHLGKVPSVPGRVGRGRRPPLLM